MCQPSKVKDINTNSNFQHVTTKHTELCLAIDFDHKIVRGSTTLTLVSLQDQGLDAIVLDTSQLGILGANIGGKPVEWELEERTDQNGQPLLIRLDRAYPQGEAFQLKITFVTTELCTGLQWFNSEQTDDKLYPFMFSQGEPVHARSIFPCQDTPSVKTTFDITISSALPVVASGVPTHDLLFPSVDGMSTVREYHFKQLIPISNYLFAFASGNLTGAKIGATSYVYSTPADIDACVAEFQPDIQTIIDTAEQLIFENPWPLYNLVVLPKSFHLGGMENPVFNFYSATVVSGDRENISIVAHEFAHTFSGNLVTNASWEHFWLNEGWTVWIEREIIRRIKGESEATFQAIVGWNELEYGIEAYGGSESPETCLVLQFQGKRPDDVMSKISYEKGYTFLRYLEGLVGKEKWLKFVPFYFRKFYQQNVDSDTFKATLVQFFADDPAATEALNSVDWHAWYHKPGLPPKPDFKSAEYERCIRLASSWTNMTDSSDFEPRAEDVTGWTAGHLITFLDYLNEAPKPLTPKSFQFLGSIYDLTEAKNFEILSRYLRVGLRSKDRSVIGPVEEFLGQTGRMKFVRPVFEGLWALDQEVAREVFRKYQTFYHPTCLRLLENVLGVTSST